MADTITVDITEVPVVVTVETTSVAGSFTMANIDHTLIQNIGTNSHAQIDTHITTTETRLDVLEGNPIIIESSIGLPAAVSGVITLITNNTVYRFHDIVSLGSDRIVITASNVVFEGLDELTDGISSTTALALITVSGENFTMRNMAVTASSSTGIIDYTGAAGTKLIVDRVTLVGGTTQIIADGGADLFINHCDFTAATNAILVTGALEDIFIFGCIFKTITGTLIDMDSCTTDSVSIDTNTGVLTATSTFITLAANGANINTGGEGTITNNKLNNALAGTPSTGYDTFEAGWLVDGNNILLTSDRVSPTGWGFYVDGETTPATQNLTTTASKLLIDGLGSTTYEGQLPRSIRGAGSLWDTTNNSIIGITDGDSFDVRIQLEITAKVGTPTLLTTQLDIGGTGTPSIVVVTDDKSVSKTPPYTLIFTFPIFTRGTFIANGGDIFLNTDTGSLTLASRSVYITRVHSGAL